MKSILTSLHSTSLLDLFFFFFSSRRRHTRSLCDWSSDVCSSDLVAASLAGDCEGGLALGRDLHDAAFAGERGGDIDIALDIKGQALRTSETAVEQDRKSVV